MTRRGYLVKGESVLKKQLSEETAEKKQERLAKRRASDKKQLSEETAEKSKKGLQKEERIIKKINLRNC